jgi:predicted  nucleic acid-binding Zn-ribbon protein
LLLETHKRKEIEKDLIEIRVENKFLKEDIINLKRRMSSIEKKYEELQMNVSAVDFNSKIYHSRQISVTAIET